MIFATSIPLFILITALLLVLLGLVFCVAKKNIRKAKSFRRLGIVALLILAAMRPAVGAIESERELSNLNIFFVVDNTGSMAVQDMDSETKFRYEKASEDMKKIVGLFPGARYSIFVLDYSSYQAMPLIGDTDTVVSYIDGLKPKNSNLSQDSDLSRLLSVSAEHIKKSSERFEERNSLLFLFSDGEDSNGDTRVPDDLSSMLSGGAVIGYGSPNGGPVRKVDSKNNIENSFVQDRGSFEPHISKINEQNLNKIASNLGLTYYRRSSAEDKFTDIKNFYNSANAFKRDDAKIKVNNELYWIPMLAASFLLLFDFYRILESLLLERRAAK